MNSAQTSSLSSVSPDEPVQFELELEELQQGGINLLETLGIAMQSLTANKLRTLLTALGIIIGVAAVIALMALGNGTSSSITETISANGANLITVRGGASSSGGVRGQVGSSQTITMRDAEALSDPIFAPSVSLVSPEYQSMGQLVAGSNNTNATVTGVYPAYLPVHNMAIEFGEFISENDVNTMANSVVLGANVATTLFPDGDSVGQSVRINGTKFTVTGVLESKGGSGFGSSDDGVFVP
jgi:putative ABC transport system permease protein